MNKVAHNRQVGPDYAKMFGIILVVWGHTIRGLISADILPADSAFWISLDRAIYLFHMPLFFFLSGLFVQQMLEKTTVVDFIKRNSLIFLLPLIFWSYAQSGIQYFASGSVNMPRTLDYVLLSPFPPKQQFWFLWSLFLISCFSAVVLKFSHGKVILLTLAVITLFVLGVGDSFNSATITYKMEGMTFGEALFFFPYFVMGVVLASPALAKSQSHFWLYLLLFFAVILFYLLLNQQSNAVYYLFSLPCVYVSYKCMACVAQWMQNHVEQSSNRPLLQGLHRFLVFIGMNSFIIYLAHIIPEAGIRVVLIKLGVSDPLIHIIAGNMAGLFLPLLLVPINVLLVRYWRLAQYFIPARRPKYG